MYIIFLIILDKTLLRLGVLFLTIKILNNHPYTHSFLVIWILTDSRISL